MDAECLLQYSQKSTWCWGVESTPQCQPLSCTLFCWSVLVLTRALKRGLHIFCLCRLPSTIFLSSAAFCIHLLVLLSGALCLLNAFQIIPIITIPFSSVDLSCLFDMTSLVVVQYFYCLLRTYIFNPLVSPAWMFSVTVVLSCDFGTTWISGAHLVTVHWS